MVLLKTLCANHQDGILIYPKNSVIKIQGLCLLLSGILQHYNMSNHKKCQTLSLIFNWTFFGSVVGSSDCKIQTKDFYKCVTDVRLLHFSLFELAEVVCSDSILHFDFFKIFNQRIKDIEFFIVITSHKNIGNRLSHFILLLACYFGIFSAEGIFLNIYISQHDIASILSTTRSTITRLINQLRKDNIIRYYRKRLILLKPVKLGYYFSHFKRYI
uniref:HTH crp-type domain-containing protein n=1 Tax=Cyanidium caldarium TaxID=2771 RepID=Q9TLZ6_CYACA|nr:global nitrogen regulator [Cyanidium caldarium]AAF12973.1 unknown [Cyanidium caldarium]WDB00246.1 global nitrogen regulator [Cyanidium caldarium]